MTPGLVVDSSAVIAVLFEEPEREGILAALLDADRRLMSALSLLETRMVVSARRGARGESLLEALVRQLELEIVPLSVEQAEQAFSAWKRFGKGRHPAGLNLGDCCSFALARVEDLPLLFKGEDFPRTDLPLVAY